MHKVLKDTLILLLHSVAEITEGSEEVDVYS